MNKLSHAIYIMMYCLMNFTSSSQILSNSSTKIEGKPIIDANAIETWPTLGAKLISDDGNYCLVGIDNEPFGMSTTEVISLHDNWRKRIVSTIKYPQAFFTRDSRKLVLKMEDSLFFLELGSDRQKTLKIKDCQSPSRRWLGYRLADDPSKIFIRDLVTGKEESYEQVINYWFDPSGTKILLLQRNSKDPQSTKELRYVDLEKNLKALIWFVKWSNVDLISTSIKFDKDGDQVVFGIGGKENESSTQQSSQSIWYFKRGMTNAVKWVDFDSLNAKGIKLDPVSIRFSENNKWIIFDSKQIPASQVSGSISNLVKLSIWSYRDIKLQPEQHRLFAIGQYPTSTFAVSTEARKMVEIIAGNENGQMYRFPGDFIVVMDNPDVSYEWKWDHQPSNYVVSLKDGSRRILKKEGRSLSYLSFSPDNKWLVYYDTKQGAYFSFNLETGVILNITRHIPTSFQSEYDGGGAKLPVAEVAGWLSNGQGLFVCDVHDIWLVDPSGKRDPINFTNGLGKKLKLKLRLADGSESQNPRLVFAPGESVLITAFSQDTKYNGFFSKKIGEIGDPQRLCFGPYVYYRTRSQKIFSFGEAGMQPVKSLNANVWIVTRQSATEAPNYYATEDFKTFRPLTDLQPQKKYNWLTSELISWKQLDGTMSQGILYKPENFDPTKKYPVLFNDYEKMSHRLYEFLDPGYSNDNINIPWFVSRGYLVFTPDIHYKIAAESGKTVGEWAYNSVVSAGQYLAKLPFVDAQRMCIQGHSFGGLQTAYIVTHTNLFAAAVEAGGGTDRISAYLSLVPFAFHVDHLDAQGTTERGQGRYGATPWERPDLFLKSSAVMSADKVTTPILIMHNEHDNNVPWRQGIEFYMALRRLSKPSWMLQYDEGGHSVEGKLAVDYTIRMTQYFDHFLKGLPAPKWMTQGIPYAMREIENGYELDPAGNCSPGCKICKQWNEKWKKNSVATMEEIKQFEENDKQYFQQ